MEPGTLTHRAYGECSKATTWEEIWEAGPYYDRVSELLENAADFAVFVGWQIDSRLEMQGAGGQEREGLQKKILRLCESKPGFECYFLLWDHAYLYVPERETWQTRIWEEIHPQVHFIFDNLHSFGASHHEKIILIDGKIALCGGVDLCGERWDSPDHLFEDPRRSPDWKEEKHGPYHDLAVQVTGPVCRSIHRHVAERWKMLSSLPFPDVPEPGPDKSDESPEGNDHRVYVSRTFCPVWRSRQPFLIRREIEFLFKELIQGAEKRIILEGQYYWSEVLHDLLKTKIHSMQGKNFEIFLILSELQKAQSFTRHMSPYELKLLQELNAAAEYSGVSLHLLSPFVFSSASGQPPKAIYIHAKTLIIDDSFLSLGSANLATRALRVDTELQLTFEARSAEEKAYIAKVAEELLRHWNLKPTSTQGGDFKHANNRAIVARRIQPSLEMRHLQWTQAIVQNRLKIEYFFDPSIPWFYLFKKRYLNRIRTGHPTLGLQVGLLWGFVLIGVGSLMGLWQKVNFRNGLEFFFLFLLSSVWILPIPFGWVAVLAGLTLEEDLAIRMILTAVWTSSILAYGVGRIFPDWAAGFYLKKTGLIPSQFSKERNFSSFLQVILNPRSGFQEKIIFPGLNFVPIPWFLLGSGILMSGVFYGLLHWIIPYLKGLVPTQVISGVSRLSGVMLWGILAGSTFKLLRRGKRRDGEKKAEDPVL